MTRALRFFPMVAAALVFLLLAATQPAHQAWAQAQTPPVGAPADVTPQGSPAKQNLQAKNHSYCRDLPEAKGGVLLGVIVPCLIHTIQNDTQDFTTKFIDWMQPAFYAFLTLVVCLFGVKVLQGERELKGQAFLFVLKVAVVIGMFQLIPNMFIPAAYGMMSEGVEAISNTIGPDSSQIHCEIQKYGDDKTPLIWKQMDCVMGKLYGFATGKGNTGPGGGKPVNMLLASSAAGLLTGFFFGGTLGVAVFFALIGVLFTIAMLVLRTAIAFLNGYLIVCLLLIASPIFVPLLLLKGTYEYFEKWWKAILGAMILPLIVSAYTMFALLAYDTLLFAPDSKLQKLFDYQQIKDAMQVSSRMCDMNVTNNPASKGKTSNADKTELDELMKNPFLQNIAQPLLSGGSDACSMLDNPAVFDVSKVKAKGFGDQHNVMVQIFLDCVKLFIMAYLIAQGVETVQSVIGSVTGSPVSGMAVKSISKLEHSFGAAAHRAQNSLSRAFMSRNEDGIASSVRGAEFVKRTPGAIKSSITDFLGGINRE